MSFIARALCTDSRGSMLVEYLVLFAIIGVGLVAIVVPILGPRMVREYRLRDEVLYAPYP